MTRPLWLSLKGQPSLPVSIQFTGIGVDVTAAAGTVIGALSTTGGLPPYTYTVSNSKFQVSGNQVQRSASGTLTAGTPESLNFGSTDAIPHSTNTATNGQGPYSLAVTSQNVPTGVITSPPAISIPATTPGNMVIATLNEQGGTGVNVVFSVTGNTNLTVVGASLQTVASPTFVAGVNQTYSLHVTDTGGTYDDASPRTLTVQAAAAPTGITLTPVNNFPTVLANATAGTVLATLSEIGGTGSGTAFTLLAGSSGNLAISGSNLVVHSSPSFTPGTSPTFGLSVTDTGGTFNDASNTTRSYTVPAGPSTISLSSATVTATAAQGTLVGNFSSDGSSPFTWGTPSNTKFQESGSSLQRSGTGTLTVGVSENVNQSVTDAAGLTTNTATNGQGPFSITVTTAPSIPNVTLANTSGSTISGPFVTPIFGLSFQAGQVPIAPTFTISATNIPFSMELNPSLNGDGSLRNCAFALCVPAGINISAHSSVTVSVGGSGSVPAPSSRTQADFTAGGLDLNVSVTGLDNLTGTWVSDLGDGVTSAFADNYKYMDGAAGTMWRVRASFKQSGARHGYLEGYWFPWAVQDPSGNLACIRHYTRVTSPWVEDNLGPAGTPHKIYYSFSAIGLYNGASQLVDLWGSQGTGQTFTWSSSSNTTTFALPGAPNFPAGGLVRLSTTGTLPTTTPTQMVPAKSYFCNTITSGALSPSFFISDNSSSIVNVGQGTYKGTDNGSGTHTVTGYPYITWGGSLWTNQTTGRMRTIQGAGSFASDPGNDNLLFSGDPRTHMLAGLILSQDMSVTGINPYTAYSYKPNLAAPVHQATGDTGDRADIGFLTAWNIAHIYTQSAADEQNARVIGLIGSQMPICVRSNTTKGSIICVNNGPSGNGTAYSNMPTPTPGLVWDANTNDATGFVVPLNNNVWNGGFNLFNSSHMPCFAYYPALITGEPHFKDMVLEWANWSVYQLVPANTGTVNSGNYSPGIRNMLLNGSQQFYGVGTSIGGRNAAWAMRYAAQACAFRYAENPSYNTYVNDLNKANADHPVAVLNILNGFNSFAYQHGVFFDGNGDAYVPTWQTSYAGQGAVGAYQITGYAPMQTFAQKLTDFAANIIDTYGGYNYCTVVSNITQGASVHSPIITSYSLFGSLFTNITSWDSGTGYINYKSTSPNTTWVPKVHDTVFFFNGYLGSSQPNTQPLPAPFADHVPYYIVQVVNNGGGNYSFKVAATDSGNPADAIVLTNSSTGGWSGWISGTTLHVTSGLTGTILAPPSVSGNALYIVSGLGVTSGTATKSVLATQPGDVATYQVTTSQTVGSSGSPVAMTGALQSIGAFFRDSNPSTTGQLNGSGPSSYVVAAWGALCCAKAAGLTVSSSSIADLVTRINAEGITFGGNANTAKYAFSQVIGG